MMDTANNAHPPRISACIVCRNEAARLPACLDSVQWVDEIVVMDLCSTDGSAAVARAHGARVIAREPFPYVEPLRSELARQAQGDWIVVLDPDERLSPGLERELRRLAGRDDLDAVVIARTNIDLGHAPRHPIQRYEPQLRMVRRDRIEWPAQIHALPDAPPERTARTPFQDEYVIWHTRFASVPAAVERSVRYAPAQAQAWLNEGRVFRAQDILAAMIDVIDKQLFEPGAWKEGMPGVLRAGLLVGAEFYAWAAFWQMSGEKRTPADDRLVWRLGGLARLAWMGVQAARRLFLR